MTIAFTSIFALTTADSPTINVPLSEISPLNLPSNRNTPSKLTFPSKTVSFPTKLIFSSGETFKSKQQKQSPSGGPGRFCFQKKDRFFVPEEEDLAPPQQCR